MDFRSDRVFYGVGAAAFIFLFYGWYQALCVAPADFQQGEVYRILFVHVPVAAAALGIGAVGLLIASLLTLWRLEERFLLASKAWTEVTLLFTSLTLISGSIWGYPTWGTFWTWDPRLTTTFILFILLLGYVMLFHSMPPGRLRMRACAILGILITVDVPIIYKSVDWWNSLHQPASLIATRGRTMAPEMLSVLLVNLAAVALLTLLMWWLRYSNLKIQDRLDDKLLEEMTRAS